MASLGPIWPGWGSHLHGSALPAWPGSEPLPAPERHPTGAGPIGGPLIAAEVSAKWPPGAGN